MRRRSPATQLRHFQWPSDVRDHALSIRRNRLPCCFRSCPAPSWAACLVANESCSACAAKIHALRPQPTARRTPPGSAIIAPDSGPATC
eukprot:3329421-Pyramimonas_sp.AAC.1